jgi:hypothetical protein
MVRINMLDVCSVTEQSEENKYGQLSFKTEERKEDSAIYNIFSLLKRLGWANMREAEIEMICIYTLLSSTLTILKSTPISCRRISKNGVLCSEN